MFLVHEHLAHFKLNGKSFVHIMEVNKLFLQGVW